MEKCGIILKDGSEVEYPNLSRDPKEFVLDPKAWIENDENIVAIFHTHPDGQPFLSSADRKSQLNTGLDWVLYTRGERKVFKPVPKLLGRSFSYGTQDCYSLMIEAYHLAGIEVPNYGRVSLEADLQSERILKFIPLHFERVGDLEDVQVGDVIVTAISGKACHMAIYLGEGKVLHHEVNKLSLRERLSDSWFRRVHSVWRHPEWNTESIQALEEDFANGHN